MKKIQGLVQLKPTLISQKSFNSSQSQNQQTQFQNSIKKFEKKAQLTLSIGDYQYFRRGADEEVTLRNNVLAFNQIKILPRVLKDMTKIQMSKTFLKEIKMNSPFGISPFAFQKLLHSQGENICAWLSQEKHIPYCISMMSTTGLKQLKQKFPNSIKMLQIYILKDQQMMKKIIKLAQQNGCLALVVTVDSPIFGKKRSGQRQNFKPNLDFQIFKQLDIDIQLKPKEQSKAFRNNLLTQLRWEHITLLKKMTKLKIVLKGILNLQDALIANDLNIDAIWISNHGGRQLDTAPLSYTVLPGIKHQLKKLKSKMQVYVDGGVRKGSDIFKYYALGADFVFLGRGFCFSLVDGYKGIEECFQILKKELQITMQLAGTKNISQITSDYLFHNNFLSLSKL